MGTTYSLPHSIQFIHLIIFFSQSEISLSASVSEWAAERPLFAEAVRQIHCSGVGRSGSCGNRSVWSVVVSMATASIVCPSFDVWVAGLLGCSADGLPQVEPPLPSSYPVSSRHNPRIRESENPRVWPARRPAEETRSGSGSGSGNLGHHPRRWLQFFGMIHDRTMAMSSSSSTRDLTHTKSATDTCTKHWEKSSKLRKQMFWIAT